MERKDGVEHLGQRGLGRAAFRALVVAAILMGGVGRAPAGLVGSWTFDGDSTADLSANGNDGVAGGSLTFETDTPAPLAGGKSMFSHAGGGAPNVLTVPTSPTLESIDDNLSVAYWMKGTTGDNANWVRIFQHGTEAAGRRSWLVNRNNNTSSVNMRLDTVGGAGQFNQNIATGGPNSLDGNWHHVAFIASDGTWFKYQDGVRVQSGTYKAGDGLSNDRPLYMFGRNATGEYVGGLDDVAVYNQSLSLADIQHLYAGGAATALPAKPESRYELNGNANDSVGPYNGTLQGGPSFVSSPLGGQALELNGSGQYVELTTAANLGLGDNFTASAWINPDVLGGDKSIFGLDTGGNDRQLHLILRNNNAHMGFYGNDTGGNRPIDTDRWQYVTYRFQNGEQAIFVDGQLDASGLNHANLVTDQPGPVMLGRWGGGHYFDGTIDKASIVGRALSNDEIRAQYLAGGTHIEDFEDTGGKTDYTRWYSGSGTNVMRLRTKDNPDGTYGLRTDGTNDQPGATLTTYSANYDAPTGIAFGRFFTVNDDTQSLHLRLAGGGHGYNAGSQTNGGSGVALWDLDANQLIPGTFVTRSGNGGSYQNASISLAGLAGKTVGVAVVDRQTGGWAWTAADSITMSTPGAVTEIAGKHKVLFDYHFDRPGDWMGWTGDTGSFQIGQANTGLVGQHVNHAGTFANGRGFISSTTAGQWDTPTGTVRSPDFTIEGDIIEFRIAGGNNPSLEAFELVRSSDGAVLRSSAGLNQSEFHYDYWGVKDLVGTQAYLRARDDNAGGWGHIEVDAIRMVELNSQTAAPMSTSTWGNAPVTHLVHANDDLVVVTAGSDIQGNSDNGGMAFLDQPVSGTFDAVAHVGFDGSIPDQWTKAGLMFRQSADAPSANVTVLATGSNRANLQWRDSTGGGTSYDQAAGGNPSNNIWLKLQRWENGEVSAYWAPDSSTQPVDGWQRFGTDVAPNFDVGLLGLAATAHNTNSVVDARFRGFAYNQNTIIDSFETYNGSDAQMNGRWNVNGDSTAIRLRTNDNPDGQYGLVTSGGQGSPTTTLNVYNSSHDDATGMAWGPAFTVLDENAYLSLNVIGGSHALNPGSRTNGGTGVALWDIQAGQLVPGTFTTRSSNLNAYEQHGISLAGLQGRQVAPVLIDRQTGGWAWGGVDSITAPKDAIRMLDPGEYSYDVQLDYHFDNAGDYQGWFPKAGSYDNFTLGNMGRGLGDRPNWYIDRTLAFSGEQGFLSSGSAIYGHEDSTGILRSPNFLIDGDVIEFLISGGDGVNDLDQGGLLAFELIDAITGSVLRTATGLDSNDMLYEYWGVSGFDGMWAYLQLRDDHGPGMGGYGHIEVDAIRMFGFSQIPEPSALGICGLGLLALGLYGRRRRD